MVGCQAPKTRDHVAGGRGGKMRILHDICIPPPERGKSGRGCLLILSPLALLAARLGLKDCSAQCVWMMEEHPGDKLIPGGALLTARMAFGPCFYLLRYGFL